MANKLAAFAQALTQSKGNDPLVLEMDAAAQEVVEEYFMGWLRARIKHNKVNSREMDKDTVYTAVVNYAIGLNSSFFYARLWSTSGIRENIWAPLEQTQELLDFVFRGAAILYARVFGKSTDTQNTSAVFLGRHIADSLAIMSATDNSLIPHEVREVFPRYKELEEQFAANPWLFFIYYITRVDIFTLIEREATK